MSDEKIRTVLEYKVSEKDLATWRQYYEISPTSRSNFGSKDGRNADGASNTQRRVIGECINTRLTTSYLNKSIDEILLRSF